MRKAPYVIGFAAFLFFLTVASGEGAPSPLDSKPLHLQTTASELTTKKMISELPPKYMIAMFKGHNLVIHEEALGISLHPTPNDEPRIVLDWLTEVGSISFIEEKWYEKNFKNFVIDLGKAGQHFRLDEASDWLFEATHKKKILNRPGEGIWNLSDNDWVILYSLNGKTYAGFMDGTAIRSYLNYQISSREEILELEYRSINVESFKGVEEQSPSKLVEEMRSVLRSILSTHKRNINKLRKEIDERKKAEKVCGVYQQYAIGKGIAYFLTFIISLFIAVKVVWRSMRASDKRAP